MCFQTSEAQYYGYYECASKSTLTELDPVIGLHPIWPPSNRYRILPVDRIGYSQISLPKEHHLKHRHSLDCQGRPKLSVLEPVTPLDRAINSVKADMERSIEFLSSKIPPPKRSLTALHHEFHQKHGFNAPIVGDGFLPFRINAITPEKRIAQASKN